MFFGAMVLHSLDGDDAKVTAILDPNETKERLQIVWNFESVFDLYSTYDGMSKLNMKEAQQDSISPYTCTYWL